MRGGWQEQLLPAAGLNLYGLRGAPLSWRMLLLAGAQHFIVCLDDALQRVSTQPPLLLLLLMLLLLLTCTVLKGADSFQMCRVRFSRVAQERQRSNRPEKLLSRNFYILPHSNKIKTLRNARKDVVRRKYRKSKKIFSKNSQFL